MGGVFRRLFGGDKEKLEEAREEEEFRDVAPGGRRRGRSRGSSPQRGSRGRAPRESPRLSRRKRSGWFRRLTRGLTRSSGALSGTISSIFTKRKLDGDILEEFEEALIRADLGIDVAVHHQGARPRALRRGALRRGDEGHSRHRGREGASRRSRAPLILARHRPARRHPRRRRQRHRQDDDDRQARGEISRRRKNGDARGRRTFRAAAIDQLRIWAQRTGSTIVAREAGADAAGLAFDAAPQAKETGVDVLIIDTAGRLQNRTELMAELEKIIRVLKKQDPSRAASTRS